MKCKECRERGFTEENHGLIMVFCDCEKGQELRANLTGVSPEETNDSDNGDRPDNQPAGSADTGQPKRTQKPKTKKKAGKKSS